MTSRIILFAFAIGLLGVAGCKNHPVTQSPASPPDTHTSRNSVDWDGVYRGTLPCADCNGIETVLILRKNQTYTLQTRILDEKRTASETQGAFTWNSQGNTITLDSKKKALGSNQYFVGENRLTQLGPKGNPGAGDQPVLQKEQAGLEEKYWKLTQLYGKPVVVGKANREPYITLHKAGNQIKGNDGCNGFFGAYTLEKPNRIRFSGFGRTLMACDNMETETQFLKALEMADSFLLKGDTLFLHKARMAPLARFEAVYLR